MKGAGINPALSNKLLSRLEIHDFFLNSQERRSLK